MLLSIEPLHRLTCSSHICSRSTVLRCCSELSLDKDDGEADDNVECTGRVVTELVDATAQDGKGLLPDRFMIAVRAIRGEFSAADPNLDTEYAEDSFLSAFVQFPADVQLRIVSRPLEADEADALVRDISMLSAAIEGAGEAEVDVTLRGQRRAIDFRLSSVPDAASIAAVRTALKEDERVQMVF